MQFWGPQFCFSEAELRQLLHSKSYVNDILCVCMWVCFYKDVLQICIIYFQTLIPEIKIQKFPVRKRSSLMSLMFGKSYFSFIHCMFVQNLCEHVIQWFWTSQVSVLRLEVPLLGSHLHPSLRITEINVCVVVTLEITRILCSLFICYSSSGITF